MPAVQCRSLVESDPGIAHGKRHEDAREGAVARDVTLRRGRIASFLWSLGTQPVRLHRIALLKIFRSSRFVLLVGCRFSNFLAAALLALGHGHSPLLCAPGAACSSSCETPETERKGGGAQRLRWHLSRVPL